MIFCSGFVLLTVSLRFQIRVNLIISVDINSVRTVLLFLWLNAREFSIYLIRDLRASEVPPFEVRKRLRRG